VVVDFRVENYKYFQKEFAEGFVAFLSTYVLCLPGVASGENCFPRNAHNFEPKKQKG
jgi:hypothetical protein